MHHSIFEPLRDPERWAEVRVDELGVVCWPNGADLAQQPPGPCTTG